MILKFKRCKNEDSRNRTKQMTQIINLVEDEDSEGVCMSEHEKPAVDKMYKCFKEGQKVYRELDKYFPTFRRKDIKNFFRILYF